MKIASVGEQKCINIMLYLISQDCFNDSFLLEGYKGLEKLGKVDFRVSAGGEDVVCYTLQLFVHFHFFFPFFTLEF